MKSMEYMLRGDKFSVVGFLEKPLIRSFFFDNSGQGLVEYSIIIALVALVAVASLKFFGTKSNNTYTNITTNINQVLN